MLQFFHKYQRTLFGIVFVLFACVLMLPFGISSFTRSTSKRSAVTVGKESLSIDEFYRRLRSNEEQYSKLLAKASPDVFANMRARLRQDIVDDFISSKLIESQARSFGLGAGSDEIRMRLPELLGGKFTQEGYQMLLARTNMGPVEFERTLAADITRNHFENIISDASLASRLETEASLSVEKTNYSALAVEIDPKKFREAVKDPGDEALKVIYEENTGDYEAPPRVAYEYIAYDPKEYEAQVKVNPEDIELYYSDNLGKFSTPEQVKVHHIQFNFGAEPDPKQMAEVKEKAEQVLRKIKAGEDFAALARSNSADLSSGLVGGDLGWIARGKMAPEFDAAAFDLKPGEVSEVIGTSYGYHIIKLDGHQDATPKRLEEVRAEIEATLRKQDAPAYTSEQSLSDLENWRRSGKSLSEFATAHGLKVSATNGLLAKEVDPSPELKGLTASVLESAEEKAQAVELGDRSIIVSVTDLKGSELQPFAEVRPKILERYAARESQTLAQKKAEELLSAIAKQDQYDLRAAADSIKLDVVDSGEISRGKAGTGVFSKAEVSRAIFSEVAPGKKPVEPLRVNESLVIFQVTSITLPKHEELVADVNQAVARETATLGNSLITAYSNKLKAEFPPEVNQQILVE